MLTSSPESPQPRHVLECPLSPALPDASVRAALAAFYMRSVGYADQQASHDCSYFSRLLGVTDALLVDPHARILEIGAGSAVALRAFLAARPGARAVALDLSDLSLRRATSASCQALSAVAGSALELPLKAGTVDTVVAFEVIEHLPDVARALTEALRVLRRPGYVIIREH